MSLHRGYSMQTWTGCYITSPLKKYWTKLSRVKEKNRLEFIKYELDIRINIFESALCYELFAADNIKLLKFKIKHQGNNNTDIIKTKASKSEIIGKKTISTLK